MNLYNESIESLQIIYNRIYENGCDLLSDGLFLLDNKRYARAYLCFQIAIEEFSKLLMINTVAIKLYNNEEVDWKTLNRRLRSHQKKNAMSTVSKDYFYFYFREQFGNKEEISIQELRERFSEFKKLIMQKPEILLVLKFNKPKEEMDKEIELKNNLKNHSLYADFKDKNFITPNEFFNVKNVKEIMLDALFQHWTMELSNIHNDGFVLYKKDLSHNNSNLQNISLKRIKFMESIIEEQKKSRDK